MTRTISAPGSRAVLVSGPGIERLSPGDLVAVAASCSMLLTSAIGDRVDASPASTVVASNAMGTEAVRRCIAGLTGTLRDVRETLGLSQVQLSQGVGTTQSAVSDLERGLVTPRTETLLRVAGALGVQVGIVVCDYCIPGIR